MTSIKLTSRSPTNPDEEIVTEVSGKALAEGLQYGPSDGIPDLLNWLYGLQERSHGRKRGEGWRISVGSGSQDVIYKVPVHMVRNPNRILTLSSDGLGYSQPWRSAPCRIAGLCVSDLIHSERDSISTTTQRRFAHVFRFEL